MSITREIKYEKITFERLNDSKTKIIEIENNEDLIDIIYSENTFIKNSYPIWILFKIIQMHVIKSRDYIEGCLEGYDIKLKEINLFVWIEDNRQKNIYLHVNLFSTKNIARDFFLLPENKQRYIIRMYNDSI